MKRFRLGAVCVVGGLALLLWPSAAGADQAYHSHHYALSAVDGGSLRSGFVENIHPNGPNVYAHENYVLNGAVSSTSYQVLLSIWASNTSCSGDPTFQIATAIVETNSAGNGKAQHIFTPGDADGLRGHTVSGMWVLWADDSPAYETGCEVVTLD